MKANHLSTAATFVAALLASATLVACEPGGATTTLPDRGEATAAALADKVIDTVGDTAITVAVNTALARDAALSVLRIEVHTTDGHVVLDGSAPDLAARERAAVLAQRVQGVRSVDNRLEVVPLS